MGLGTRPVLPSYTVDTCIIAGESMVLHTGTCTCTVCIVHVHNVTHT